MRRQLLLLLATAAALTAADPVVNVTGGQIQGRLLDKGATFKGIPYAAPPVGALRWKEPAAVKPWQGVRDAGNYGATCAQMDAGWNRNSVAVASEDCLFVNVWTPEWPATPSARRPVMFWIHGGGNMGGSSLGLGGIEPPFDGKFLAAKGVVVISLNYRLGLLGFLAHPELTAESPHHASGNYAILDQIAALKWVRDNAATFGGDPANVTIFGQSAGAHDVGLLLVSPLSKGLFRNAIEESGSVIISGRMTASLKDAEAFGQKLAANLKAPATGQLAYMRSLSFQDVLKGSPAYGGGEIGPDVDGYVITKPPAESFLKGETHRVPFIIGNNARERSLAGGPDALRTAIREYYGPLADRALALYGLSGKPQENTYPPHGDANAQFATDNAFRCSGVTIANWYVGNATTYQYEFSRNLPGSERGATHSGELAFLFGIFAKPPAEADTRVSDQLQTYWTNFAKTGDPNGAGPNGSGLTRWPKYDAKARPYLEFTADGSTTTREGLRRAFCDIFEERVKDNLKASH